MKAKSAIDFDKSKLWTYFFRQKIRNLSCLMYNFSFISRSLSARYRAGPGPSPKFTKPEKGQCMHHADQKLVISRFKLLKNTAEVNFRNLNTIAGPNLGLDGQNIARNQGLARF